MQSTLPIEELPSVEPTSDDATDPRQPNPEDFAALFTTESTDSDWLAEEPDEMSLLSTTNTLMRTRDITCTIANATTSVIAIHPPLSSSHYIGTMSQYGGHWPVRYGTLYVLNFRLQQDPLVTTALQLGIDRSGESVARWKPGSTPGFRRWVTSTETHDSVAVTFLITNDI
ncbi:hypothetical protein BDV93DRAFT_609877 [Ceratobasidium sp. AG-I]|nr:hypothetical protein BDV93DRAFT_609877 [Ceratobasidium sp. AG-I]